MELAHSVAAVTVQNISKPADVTPRHPNDVDFMVKYPDGYQGPKYMPEGPVVVSKEAAEKFTEQGIGNVITPAEETIVIEPEGPVVVSKEAAEKQETKSKADKKVKPN